MRTLRALLVLIVLFAPVSALAAPTVSNVQFTQQADGFGSTEIIATYDLASPNGDAEVTLLYSLNGGGDFTTATLTTGDVGSGVSPGTGLSITWDVSGDVPGTESSNVVLRVLAEDGVAIPLTITSSETDDIHQTETQLITFTFDEAVSGFDASDVTLVGATGDNFTPVSDSLYTMEITGIGGTLSVTVAGSAAASKASGTATLGDSISNFYQDIRTFELQNSPLVEMEVIRIPAGEFVMGSPASEGTREWDGTDETEHDVVISNDYYMGRTEVTQSQWHAIEGSFPGGDPTEAWGLGDDRPVYSLYWTEMDSWLADLTTAMGGTDVFSMPTEAEMEYAMRAGTTTPFSFGNSANLDFPYIEATCPPAETLLGDNMWYCATPGADGKAQVVAQKPANPWGLYDMHGNLWEATADFYGTYPSTPPAVVDPTGPATGTAKVIRGGVMLRAPSAARSARRFRFSSYTTFRARDIGFRVTMVNPMTMTISSRAAGDGRDTSKQLVTFNFQAEVGGFDLSDIELQNGVKESFKKVSRSKYTLEVSAAEGTPQVKLLTQGITVNAPYTHIEVVRE